MSPISDVIAINNEKEFVRTIYAGNAIQTVTSTDPISLMTIRGTSFPPVANTGGSPVTEEGKY